METIAIEYSPLLAKLARSRVYWLVAASTGVFSVSAPMALFNAGREGLPLSSPAVIFLFIFIYTISLYYIVFGIKLVTKLREQRHNT